MVITTTITVSSIDQRSGRGGRHVHLSLRVDFVARRMIARSQPSPPVDDVAPSLTMRRASHDLASSLSCRVQWLLRRLRITSITTTPPSNANAEATQPITTITRPMSATVHRARRINPRSGYWRREWQGWLVTPPLPEREKIYNYYKEYHISSYTASQSERLTTKLCTH